MVKKKIFFYLFYSLDESLKLDPNDANAWNNKGNALINLN